jgi:hypothetical protein
MRVSLPKKHVAAKAMYLLPFSVIPQDGAPMQDARVSDFFLVDEDLTATFRGREVKGAVLPMPDGYGGAVVMVTPRDQEAKRNRESGDEDSDAERDEGKKKAKVAEREGTVTKTFKSMVVFGHDSAPLDSDNPLEWVKWPKLAVAINDPVPADKLARTETEPAL